MAKQPTPSHQQRRIPLHGAPIISNTPPPKRDDEPEHHQVVVEDWDEEPATPALPAVAPDQPEKVSPPIDVGGKPLNKVPAKFRKLL